jgi:hypothetical protein
MRFMNPSGRWMVAVRHPKDSATLRVEPPFDRIVDPRNYLKLLNKYSASREGIMRQLSTLVAVLALTAFVGATAAPAAPGDTYKMRKAECKKQAVGMNFGVHLIKKNRWVKDCIAGKHPA